MYVNHSTSFIASIFDMKIVTIKIFTRRITEFADTKKEIIKDTIL